MYLPDQPNSSTHLNWTCHFCMGSFSTEPHWLLNNNNNNNCNIRGVATESFSRNLNLTSRAQNLLHGIYQQSDGGSSRLTYCTQTAVCTRKTIEGWPLLTVETEANGDSRSAYERDPSLACPRRPASWAGSRATSPISLYMSLVSTHPLP